MLIFDFERMGANRYKVLGQGRSFTVNIGEFVPRSAYQRFLRRQSLLRVGAFANFEDKMMGCAPFYLRHVKGAEYSVLSGREILDTVGTLRFSAEWSEQARKNFPSRKTTYGGLLLGVYG